MNFNRVRMFVLAAISLAAPAATLGITLGQVDTFEDGTLLGWNARPNNNGVPKNVTRGSNDHYLSTMAFPSGGPPDLGIFNQTQWSGNYLAGGVTGVEMDLINTNPFGLPLSMRIAIRNITNNFEIGYCSTTPFILPDDGQWHHATFSLTAGSLTAVNSPAPLATVLANVLDFRIIHSVSPHVVGDSISLVEFGVDNITAVPEPAAIITAAIGLLTLCCRLALKR